MIYQRAKVAELLRRNREFLYRVKRDQLREMLTEAYGSEQAEESLKEFHLPVVTENEIDAVMERLNMAVLGVSSMVATIEQHKTSQEPSGWTERRGGSEMSNEQKKPTGYGGGGITTMVWNEGVKSYDVRTPGSGYTAVPIVPLQRPEPKESDLTPDPDPSTWRTRPGLF
jgi:hypothetical protein